MNDEITVTIKFVPPSEDSPGYLRRVRQAIAFMEDLKSEPSVKLIDDLIGFLLPYVKEPADRQQAFELMLDASKADFQTMLTAVAGKDGAENPT